MFHATAQVFLLNKKHEECSSSLNIFCFLVPPPAKKKGKKPVEKMKSGAGIENPDSGEARFVGFTNQQTLYIHNLDGCQERYDGGKTTFECCLSQHLRASWCLCLCCAVKR